MDDSDLAAKPLQRRPSLSHRLGAVLSFGLGSFVVFCLASLTTTYVLNRYDAELGQLGTAQIDVLLSIAGALLTMTAFAVGIGALRRSHGLRFAFLLGATCSTSYIATGWTLGWFVQSPGLLAVVLFLTVASLLASCIGTSRR